MIRSIGTFLGTFGLLSTKAAAYHPFVGEHQDKSAVMRDDGSVAMKLTGR